ncbi:MAG TPA: TlpA disulfide reductase family protein [Syntrophales bacterium]|nr:TlpA disulfide reductase family protein [Syntrophales bacterium]HOX94536.1 TlpA disulfide reductase family protein [Syntrophales bacterium]HPI58198.1 TlpA disulfide reductase family protein [Syntrophales bacterium]HPN26036.1 TlpA disulfide reductase family protein [Syntrophales bacterium]HQM30311.1 TlpA disulfide reductase family protein [Syntrophales bacterium]
MKKILRLSLLVLSMLYLFPLDIMAAGPPAVGGTLPAFTLPQPGSTAGRDYLGLDSRGNFTVPDIKAKVVLIEILSMYCPFCQKEAPEVNKLYEAIEGNPGYRGNIKLIGIGVGNSAYELEVFRKRYNVPFPLFPDADFALHKLFGETRTPYFIAVRINEDRTHKVVYSKAGSLGEVKSFIENIAKLSGLK